LDVLDTGSFTDADVSGAVAIWDRPGGKSLRRFLEANPNVKHLAVLKLDRLGRSTIDLLNTMKWLEDHGISLHIVDFGGTALTTMGPLGRILLTVLAGMAEFERELIRSRIQDRMDIKRENGELCGTVPYGWEAIETGAVTNKGIPVRILADNPEEQQVILQMVRQRNAGFSYKFIATQLNLAHVPTKRAGQVLPVKKGSTETFIPRNRWTQGQVRKILNSRTVRDWLASLNATGPKSSTPIRVILPQQKAA
jgi:site-specific DNA recombinase